MAFTLTGLPRFYNLTKTAWDAGVEAEKIEAGAVYFVTDGTETTLYVGKADNAFLTITDPTVVTQITNAIDQIRANDIEFSADYDYSANGSNVEAAISYIMENLDAVQGPDGGLGKKMNKLEGPVVGDKLLITKAGDEDDIKESEIAIGSIATKVNGVAVANNEVTIDGEDVVVGGDAAIDGKYLDIAVTDSVRTAFEATSAAIDALADDKADSEHTHVMADITDSNWALGADKLTTADRIVLVDAAGAVKESDKTLADFADADHTHTVEDLELGKALSVAGVEVAAATVKGVTGVQAAIDAIEDLVGDLVGDNDYVNGRSKIVTADKITIASAAGEVKDSTIDIGAVATSVNGVAVSGNAVKVTGKDTEVGSAVSNVTDDGIKIEIASDAKIDAALQTLADKIIAVKDHFDSITSAVLTFKGVKAKAADLPTTANIGDVYYVTEASAEFVYLGTTDGRTQAWEKLGDVEDYSLFVTAEDNFIAGNIIIGSENGTKKAEDSGKTFGSTETTSAGTANAVAMESAVKADFDDIIAYLSWKTEM
jgi:hypothetical protein